MEHTLGLMEAHVAEKLDGALAGLLAREPSFHAQHLGELRTDGEGRVQVRRRVLEDGTDLAPVDSLPGPARSGGNVLARKGDRSTADAATGRQEPEGGPAGERLAATRLADQPHRLARSHSQRHAPHCGRQSVVDAHIKVVDT